MLPGVVQSSTLLHPHIASEATWSRSPPGLTKLYEANFDLTVCEMIIDRRGSVVGKNKRDADFFKTIEGHEGESEHLACTR